MTLIRIDHSPRSLQINVPLNIILPNPIWEEQRNLDSSKMPVLFLLHGLSDDSSAWQRYTNIETLAWDMGFIVVMPSGGRSMYANMDNGQAYFDYIHCELPDFLDKTFKFDLSPQNCLIAGNSMGGMGAFKAAFLHPERYGAALSLSGSLIPDLSMIPQDKAENRQLLHEMDLLYGGLEKVNGSVDDPKAWLAQAANHPGSMPALYSCCGTDDDLLQVNRIFRQACEALKIPLTYWEEEGGRHDWFFWQRNIEKWLRMIMPPHA
ncbi:MAG: alpha/beta hydrolase family protein [Anaerolineaceae bacterium]|nr:alpha/beta hydrolase family protein [Anaerolineaceae bacterium]